jgi:hypothetical protein
MFYLFAQLAGNDNELFSGDRDVLAVYRQGFDERGWRTVLVPESETSRYPALAADLDAGLVSHISGLPT